MRVRFCDSIIMAKNHRELTRTKRSAWAFSMVFRGVFPTSFEASFPIFCQYVGTSRSVFRTLSGVSFTVFQAVFGAFFGVSFTNLSGRSRQMSYRKVGALEQCWYIIRWKISQLFRRKKK